MTTAGLVRERYMRHLLNIACNRPGVTMSSWAQANGIPLSHVDACLKHGRPVGGQVARALGFERVSGYRKIGA